MVWPRPVSEAAGSQRQERAGWNGPAPLPPLLAAGSNALAPLGGVKAAIRPVTPRPLSGGERIVGPHQPKLLAAESQAPGTVAADRARVIRRCVRA